MLSDITTLVHANVVKDQTASRLSAIMMLASAGCNTELLTIQMLSTANLVSQAYCHQRHVSVMYANHSIQFAFLVFNTHQGADSHLGWDQ